jgi:hypothetical protein
MMYSVVFLAALLCFLLDGSAASTQTRAMSGRGSIAALNNLVVIGDGAGNGAGAAGDGDISFSFYTYAVTTANVVTASDYAQAIAAVTAGTGTPGGVGGNVANTVTQAVNTDLAGNTFKGLGHAVAIADMNTVFVSQSKSSAQTGRVVVYEGNVTSFSQKQLLIPYDGAHRLDSAAFFGESIAAKHDALAVGCQNCNSSAPVFSGAVFVYKPTDSGRWSESQVLTADGVLFLGERVAMHDKVLVAAGDDSSGLAQASQHNFDNTANTVVVFEEGHHGKFEQRQVITTRSGSFRESITGLTVFDETIAITTMGTDLPTVGTAAARDKVYIYYPMSERYGLAPTGKHKPAPQQWTNTQILTVATSTYYRYILGEPMTSISMNSLMYLTTDNTNVHTALSHRECLSCAFTVPVATDTSIAKSNVEVLLTSDSNAFYSLSTGTADVIADPSPNSLENNCLTISLQDRYNDGWGIASLVITGPDGHQDKFTLQCTTANPNVFKYCPRTNKPGKYNLHIENGEETPFGWEIIWKVAAGSTWYYGDRHTHMDFLWDEKYSDFHVGVTKELLPLIDTCVVCDPNKPAEPTKPGPHRRLSNLRALHHKGVTSSPTMTQSPTLTTTGNSNNHFWNQFAIQAGQQWFDTDYNGAAFYVSDAEGKRLIFSGTSCYTGGSNPTLCWVDLPDGDYRVRAGNGISDSGVSTTTWTFCSMSNAMPNDAELLFTVLDQQCYAGAFYEVETLCANTYKSAYYLNVDLVLDGGRSVLSSSDKSSLQVAVSETMLSVLGSAPSSSSFEHQEVADGGLKVSMVLEFGSAPDASALTNFVRDTSSASSLLKYELIGSQSLSTNFLHGDVAAVRIVSATSKADAHDYSNVDESLFKTVSDHVWKTASVEQSENFNTYAKYVAEGAYAIVAVAAVLAVSLFARRAMSKNVVSEDEK